MISLSSRTTLYQDAASCYALQKALAAFCNDLKGIFGAGPLIETKPDKSQIRIIQRDGFSSECFSIETEKKENLLIISGSDEMGLIFGIYHTAEHLLGVDPFMFWNGMAYPKKAILEIPDIKYHSPDTPLEYRGWFINDEDCLTGWDDSISISDRLWEQIFETMLRNGYNTVIPGTGTTPDDSQLDIASSMGLWVAQHHAEPLGAPMFHDKYPKTNARLPEEKDKFEALYRGSILRARQRKTLWTLGFRGQGDRPFFEDDPRYDTPEKRGRLIGEMIRFQKSLVSEMTRGPQVFLHYLYSESGELYRSRHLELPEEVIPVYSDNGFGGMRVRREFCGKEPGIPALPEGAAPPAGTGVYYHVSFHDLEISNKLVPLVHPEVIKDSLKPFTENAGFRFFIVNVSNIRPHLFSIGMLRKLWDRPSEETLSDSIDHFMEFWAQQYFPGVEKEGENLMMSYFDAPFQFDDRYSDSRAGEQVYHHGLRRIIRSLIRNEDPRPWFRYIPEDFPTPEACLKRLLEKSKASIQHWRKGSEEAVKIHKNLTGEYKQFFIENLYMHIHYMLYSCEGFICGLTGALDYYAKDFEKAFIHFHQSRNFTVQALEILREGEKGQWRNFYRGDWLTGTKETIRNLETMLSVTRITGEDLRVDSPWMTKALGLEHSAISFLPQANISDVVLANKLFERDNLDSRGIDLSVLSERDL